MFSPAIGAGPGTDFQRHGFLIAATFAANLAGRRPAVRNHYLPAIPRGLVFDLATEFVHSHVTNRARQVVILHHAAHVQIFQGNHIGAADDRCGGLVQEIGPHGGNPGVQLGDLDLLAPTAIAALALSGQGALLMFQAALHDAQMLRIAGLVAIAGNHHVLDAEVQPDSLTRGRQRLNLHFAGERDEIPPARVFTDRRHLGCASRDYRPADLDKPKLGQFQEFTGAISSLYLALIQRVAHGLPVIATLELGIATAFLEEILESLVLINQALRQAAGGGIRQPGEFALLPLRDQPAQRYVAVPLLALFPGLVAQVQAPIPNEPGIAKLDCQLFALVGVRVDAELVGLLYTWHVNMMHRDN